MATLECTVRVRAFFYRPAVHGHAGGRETDPLNRFASAVHQGEVDRPAEAVPGRYREGGGVAKTLGHVEAGGREGER